jgi:hypothetical protein
VNDSQLEVEYEPTVDDFRALYRYLLQDQRQGVPQKQLPWFLLELAFAIVLLVIDVALVLLIAYYFSLGDISLPNAAVWSVFSLVFFGVNIILFCLVRDLRFGVRGHTRIWLYRLDEYIEQQQRAGTLDLHRRLRVILTPEAFTEVTEKRQQQGQVNVTTLVTSTAPWTEIPIIHITAEHAFFRVGNAGWLILPRRIFDTEAEFFHFVATAKRYQQDGYLDVAAVPSDPPNDNQHGIQSLKR